MCWNGRFDQQLRAKFAKTHPVVSFALHASFAIVFSEHMHLDMELVEAPLKNPKNEESQHVPL